jgi:hypothetical protein
VASCDFMVSLKCKAGCPLKAKCPGSSHGNSTKSDSSLLLSHLGCGQHRVEVQDVVYVVAPWCNWLTRGPFKAESPGSSPGGATKKIQVTELSNFEMFKKAL